MPCNYILLFTTISLCDEKGPRNNKQHCRDRKHTRTTIRRPPTLDGELSAFGNRPQADIPSISHLPRL